MTGPKEMEVQGFLPVFMESNKVILDHNQKLSGNFKTHGEVIMALKAPIQDITLL